MTPDSRRTGPSFVFITCLLIVIPLATAVRAQETTGTIFGSLTDQTDAVLPGVKVVVASADTGQIREVMTNRVGQYTVALPIGKYEVRFLLPNFRPFIVSSISLHVNDRLRINAKLEVGVVETLTVEAERFVQPTAAVQTLIQPVAIRELPLISRTPIQLVTLVPGVSSDLREDACFCDQGNLDISINGARRSAVNWLLDGASNVNGWNNYTLVTTPSLEAIQEINVITSTYSAEWGRNGGGVVNAVTKSGGQRFSGSAYDFVRHDGLNANSFFRKMSPVADVNSKPPRLRYNNFGYTAGGPALPSRTRVFFFLSQEFRRSSRDRIPVRTQVPDPAWLTEPGNPNYVPPEARDANAVKLLALWPAPNVAGTNRYEAVMTNRLDTHQEFGRADYHANAQWALTGRYLHDHVDSRGEYVADAYLTPGHRYLAAHLAVAETRSVRGRLVHEAAYQLSSHQQSRNDAQPTRAGLGIGIAELFPENEAQLVPRVIIRGPWGEAQAGGVQPGAREYLNHAVSSALTVHYDTHSVKFGGVFAAEHMNSNISPATTQGLFVFQPAAGSTGFQHFLRGNSNGACGVSCFYSETDFDVRNQFRTRRYEAYAQDTWRLHPNITVDAGLRYAFAPPVVDESGGLLTFVRDAYDPAQAPAFTDSSGVFLLLGTGTLFNGIRVAGKNSPFGDALHAADTNNLQPRLGIAWDPGGSGRVVLRAGYGVYFDQTQLEMFAQGVQLSWFDPFRTDAVVTNASLSNPGGSDSAPQLRPKPLGQLIPDLSQPGVLTPPVFATSDRLIAPRWQHWNLGVQRRLYAGGSIDLGYIASRGDHLLRYVDVNRPQPMDLLGKGRVLNTVRPFPGYGQIVMRESTAKSRYQGLAASFRHESGAGMWATVNYTLSRNKADATYDNAFVDNSQNPLDAGADFGSALTDRSHIFNASYVYRLPFAREATGIWRRALLQGWQIAGITRIESGPAARVRTVNCNYDDACLASLRPNQIGDPAAGERGGLQWIDPEAFVPSAAGEYGNAPVAPFRLPGRHQWDVTVSKIIDLGARRLQFRADVINAFNHTQFLDVNTSCVGTTTCGSSFGRVTSARPPREIQLGVRFDW
jgi:hypothetical protein